MAGVDRDNQVRQCCEALARDVDRELRSSGSSNLSLRGEIERGDPGNAATGQPWQFETDLSVDSLDRDQPRGPVETVARLCREDGADRRDEDGGAHQDAKQLHSALLLQAQCLEM